jgi:uncharacterized repeat protein (TIGR03803 family)
MHKVTRNLTAAVAFIEVALCVPLPTLASETTLYSLPCYPLGNEPYAGLAMDKDGDLFGTTFAGGSVNLGTTFELIPPGTGSTSWTATNIYSFGSQTEVPPVTDATRPMSVLLEQKKGIFIGTGYESDDLGCGGTGCGAIFSLTPPTSGQTQWAEQVLYDFEGGADGANPAAGLIADGSGNLYGTTLNGGSAGAGTVFELSPPGYPGGPWTESILLNFHNGTDGGYPMAPLIIDGSGSLYGTTQDSGEFGAGTVFKLAPPATVGAPWTETVLYTFGLSGAPADGDQPVAGLVEDANGALYGTTLFGGTAGRGVVFELVPPAAGQTTWTETTLYSFTNGTDGALPSAGVLLKNNGTLYGTTEGTGTGGSYGTVFKLTPPKSGSSIWKEKTLYQFSGGTDGKYPLSPLISDSAGNFYGTTIIGGAHSCGAVFEVTP